MGDIRLRKRIRSSSKLEEAGQRAPAGKNKECTDGMANRYHNILDHGENRSLVGEGAKNIHNNKIHSKKIKKKINVRTEVGERGPETAQKSPERKREAEQR